MSLIGFLKEFAEAVEDIKEENEKHKRSVEATRVQSRRRGRR